MATILSGTLPVMADKPRPRMIFDCPERLRRAIRIRAAKTGRGPSEVITSLLEGALADELEEADEALAAEEAQEKRKGKGSA